jgi:hypothetical protein
VGKARASNDDKLHTQLLDGLRQALDGSPRRLQGTGQIRGLFSAGKTGSPVAKRALDEGLLKQVPPTEQSPSRSSRAKPPVFVVITDKGRQLVLDSDSPITVLKALGDSLVPQGVSLANGVQAALAEVVSLRESVEQLRHGFQAQLATYQQTAQALEAAIERARRQGATAPVPSSPSLPPSEQHRVNWLDEVVHLVVEQKQRNQFERLTLPRIYEHLKKTRPDLSLGQFHDGLRRLQTQRRIRLTAYTQALATLEDAQNALYLDREVKFYVDLP